jgi:uncharacterized phage infection (PIP) family protein YhgE
MSIATTTAGLPVDRLGTVLEELLATSRNTSARLGEIVDQLAELNAKLPSVATGAPPEGMGRSSVEVKTSVRGVDLTCKAYDGSDIGPVGTAAMNAYFDLLAEAQRRLQEAR